MWPLLVLALFVATALPAWARWPGELDRNFGVDGIATTPPSAGIITITAMVYQPDGKIVAAGNGTQGMWSRFGLIRYNPDGSVDTTFGNGGSVMTAFGFYDAATAIVLQPDGKVVAAGYVRMTDNSNAGYMVVARYDPNGSLDPGFGAGGKVYAPMTSSASSLLLQPDGKLVVGGIVDVPLELGNALYFALLRLNPDGSVDTTFGTDGVRIETSAASAGDLALRPDGRIVAATSEWAEYGSTRFVVAQYNPDGTRDPSFGVDGFASTQIRDGGAPRGMVLQPDGRVVVAGTVRADVRYYFALARFATDGSLDPSFGSGGIVVNDTPDQPWTPSTQHVDLLSALALESNGKLVVGGSGRYGMASTTFLLTRFLPDGTRDERFGDAGTVFTKWGTDQVSWAGVRSLIAGANGWILAGGSRFNGASRAILAHYSGGTCGDGIVDGGEDCEDGNAVDGDGCDSNCSWTGCGNGIVTDGEPCDDGNLINDDPCTNACALNVCGDGFLNYNVETCDDGNDVLRDGCELCHHANCGNHWKEGAEECDDGNDVPDDGCESDCTLSPCGNGILTPDEQCDDHNRQDWDGCSSTCRLDLIPGGGAHSTDCALEWMVDNPVNAPPVDAGGRISRRQTCYDNWPQCDFDGGVVGSCTFHVSMCSGMTDSSLPSCPATAVKGLSVTRPSSKSDRASELALRSTLSSVMARMQSVGSGVCSPPMDVVVPMGGSLQSRTGHLRMSVRASTDANQIDTDSLILVCKPNPN